MVRSSGGFTCTCSECETCAQLVLARANRQTAEGTTNIFGKRVTGHPPTYAPILAHFCLSGDDFDAPVGCATRGRKLSPDVMFCCRSPAHRACSRELTTENRTYLNAEDPAAALPAWRAASNSFCRP